MKVKILFLFLVVIATHAYSQTLQFNNGDGYKSIDDATASKEFTLTKTGSALSFRALTTTPFTTVVNDGDGQPVVGLGDHLKKGTALGTINSVSPAQGIYTCGTEITGSSNYVDIDVKITSPGYYTIVTDVKDGVLFYATGYSEAKSSLNVRLQAIGTPLKTSVGEIFTVNFGGNFMAIPAINFANGTACTAMASTAETATQNGTFTEGQALNQSTDKIDIKLTVNTNGYYSFTSVVKNGIFFHGVAKLTAAAGPQTISLKGYGTPVAASTDPFAITGTKSIAATAIKVNAAASDVYNYVIDNDAGVYKIEFNDSANSKKYTVQIIDPNNIPPYNVEGEQGSVYDDFVYSHYEPENLKITPYGLMINNGTNGLRYPKGGSNTVHIFLDEMGNSLITSIPQGLPDIQYVVHVIYNPFNHGKKISYGITDQSTFIGGNRIENNGKSSSLGTLHAYEDTSLKEYILTLKTADSNIDFSVVRFENGIGLKPYKYTIKMTSSYTASINVGLLNTWLKNPKYSLVQDPLDNNLSVAKQEEGNNRGYVTIFATLYTSPLTLFKYYRDKKRIKEGKKITDINNPVADFQLYSKDYLYMRPFWERIYPTIGVGISDKVFENLFFGLNWEFARGGSFFAGGHYGKVNVFNKPDGFKFEKTNLTQAQYDLYKNVDWQVGWTVGVSLDFTIIENLFK